MDQLWDLLVSIRIADLFDIAIITAITFVLLAILRETRSSAALQGLVGVIIGAILLYGVARIFGLSATVMLFEKFWIVIVLIFLIVFQNEFRKALTDVGQLRLFRRIFARSSEHLEEILKAVRSFSRQKIGALICIERQTPLDNYADTGTRIDGLISSELLRTIFMTYSPLHDGAVIIRNDRILAAACILPLASDPLLSKEYGTRHLAAIGLSQETDAMVIVVSEETGIISLAFRGKIERNHTLDSLRKQLVDLTDARTDEITEEAVTPA
ncbi:MAG: diadenylate cyclase CdaA [Candidatus Sumerlaeaceae bacterium]|nr:diadenylate cyclase CdaA [Candidatus Sumerlaeaceae bacterium]